MQIFLLDVVPEVFHILLESFDPSLCDPTGSERTLSLEGFFDPDITRFLQLVELNAEIARSGFGFFLEKGKFRLLNTDEQ